MADAGWSVRLHDPLSGTALAARGRAYALTQSSRRLLERLGLWDALHPSLTPFTRLALLDRGCRAGVAFTPLDLPLDASAGADRPIGWIARHGDLMRVLRQRLERLPAVEMRLGEPPPSPQAGGADLVLAADGPGSPCRESSGIRRWRLPYRQACLTAQLQLRGNDDLQAWELLRPEGPMAVLPLASDQVQLVWSAPAERCRQLLALPETAFLERLAAVLPEPLEVDGLLDAPAAFPVALELARRLHRDRLVLLGESAHRCHPVGGQGLNLCWRDVATLHRLALQVADGRLPLARLGPRYSRNRWPDVLITLVATDLMVRLFSNRMPPLLLLRRLALAALAACRPLRRLSLWVMSEGTGRPSR